MHSLSVYELAGLTTFVLDVEATLATKADLDPASINWCIQEFVHLGQRTVSLILAFVIEKVPEVIVVEKLVTILCSLFAGACLLIFKHCCDPKVNNFINYRSRGAF